MKDWLGQIRAFARYPSALAREIAYSLSIWNPSVPDPLRGPVAAFIAVNSTFWNDGGGKRPGILVEGHLSQYGPNYLLRTAVAAKAIQQKAGLEIDVVFNGFSFEWDLARRIYRSFRIEKFLHLDGLFAISNIGRAVASRIVAARLASRLRRPEDILEIEFGDIKVGDLIYDDVLKLSGRKTIDRIDGDVIRTIAKSNFFYRQYVSLFRERQYEYYVSTHSMYSEYGLLCRVALSMGVKVIESTDIQMSFYDTISRDHLPTYHDGIRNSIIRGLGDPGFDVKSSRTSAADSLQRRLDSQVRQIDAQRAYRGRVYSRKDLAAALGFPASDKVVFVLAHIFSDAPHLSSGMLHADYYQWLLSTLRTCSCASGVQWVIKPHPSVNIYGEEGLVEGMVKHTGAGNVFLCPPDLNTRSLGSCADAIVTVHGTAGLEFSCLGVPVVLAGRPFYSGFGFAIEPGSTAEYEQTLQSLDTVAPLSEEQRNRALEVYAIWDRQFDWSNPIITTDVLENVWGSGQPRNLAKAYDLIAENLRGHDPRTLKLWQFAQSVVK